MENNTNQIKLEELKEVFDKIIETITPIIKSIADTITNIMSEINTKKLIEYGRLYKQSQWKYVKKGQKYVKVRRHIREDIAITFSRKIKHFKKKYNDLYHLSGKIEFIYPELYVTKWSLFKKYKDLDLYLSNSNKAILSSKKGDTLNDLENLIEKLKSKRVNRYRNVGGVENG